MAIDVSSQANLIAERLHQRAIGTLYRGLNFINRTTKESTDTPRDNGEPVRIPLLGTVASNVRAPGADVTDTTESPTQRTMTIIERETSWRVDPTWAASPGKIAREEQRMVSRANQLGQDVMSNVLETIALSGGLASVGTLGVAVAKGDMDSARKQLTDGSIAQDPRLAIVSTDMMTDLSNVAEYSDFDSGGIAGIHAAGVVTRAAGFEIIESPYAYSPAGGQHIGFACDPESIYTLFPMQETFNKGDVAVKTEAELDGMRLYMLREYSEKMNGGERWTLSIRYAVSVARDAGVILINGK